MELHLSRSGQDDEDKWPRRLEAQSQTTCPVSVERELKFREPLLSLSEILHLTGDE